MTKSDQSELFKRVRKSVKTAILGTLEQAMLEGISDKKIINCLIDSRIDSILDRRNIIGSFRHLILTAVKDVKLDCGLL